MSLSKTHTWTVSAVVPFSIVCEMIALPLGILLKCGRSRLDRDIRLNEIMMKIAYLPILAPMIAIYFVWFALLAFMSFMLSPVIVVVGWYFLGKLLYLAKKN